MLLQQAESSLPMNLMSSQSVNTEAVIDMGKPNKNLGATDMDIRIYWALWNKRILIGGQFVLM